ncbi:MAG: phosphoribosylaminoimidazolecarboxamide formyltransferase/IMP cyclohydrolase [Bacteroidetes bacterium]|nr:phosphoribosylaminoimidazolecarboxamide formyltransferase/IMP cyclohydrolase [Bacteroidota bacterium]MBP1678210.1 phosphoribosylaminoimidazolecarboxamide formyltransferase/IMP cyclohydrolase [Bacteroidota bacterium]
MPIIRRALLSVSDKRGLVEFARALRSMNIELISTGGTYTTLHSHGVDVTPVSAITGFPEILDGRVKTLHPNIHAALLAVADNPDHVRQLQHHNIEPIDMVVVNLYPFEQTVAREDVSLEEAIENIDIGGPAMLRSASKNYRHKAVVVNPDRYNAIIGELRMNAGTISEETCFALAREVFRHTSAYDAAIARYLAKTADADTGLPETLTILSRREQALRYGENPHQRAALYGSFGALFRHLHGKELSFNNIVDIAAAASLVAEFDEPTVAIIKHTNPCGVGSAPTLAEAYAKAFATDTKSPFGGIIAVNRPLDMEAATAINAIFTEVVIAPDFPADVLQLLEKKKDRRLVRLTGDLRKAVGIDIRSVPGGYLVQDADPIGGAGEEFRTVTRRAPTEAEERALRFAWKVATHVKSNAIVYAREDRTMGVGAGQMSRVDSARIAVSKAAGENLSLQGSVVASDAFFPFADGLLEAVRAGATAVIQPGGSIRDEEVIRAADENNIAMVFTGTRHFRH